jgi:hypothetical protein
MKPNTIFATLAVAAVCAVTMSAPIVANAQSTSRQQKNKNQWRNLSYGAGAATAYGLLKHDKTITILGAAGTLYSLNRYERDRKSQSRADHDRANYYGRSSFMQGGHRYRRQTVTRNGHKYYTYKRG